MKNNILITSAGRRVELIESFKEALNNSFPSSLVLTTDLNPSLSSACQISDKYFQIEKITAESYISSILNICIKNQVGLVIPTIDTELLKLSEARKEFESHGISIVISEKCLIKKSRDKRKTSKLFDFLDIDNPKIYSISDLPIPCFCKPYDGSSSIGAMIINHKSQLTDDILNNPKNMFMELISKDFTEYTIDGYYSKDGNLKCLVPRKRLEVRAGEVSKAITRKNFVYDYLLKRVKTLEGARGCITFQLFVNEETQSIKGLEINPRFGGGYPLAKSAGANYPQWLIEEYLSNKSINFFDNWENNLTMLRYDAKVLIHDSN